MLLEVIFLFLIFDFILYNFLNFPPKSSSSLGLYCPGPGLLLPGLFILMEGKLIYSYPYESLKDSLEENCLLWSKYNLFIL